MPSGIGKVEGINHVGTRRALPTFAYTLHKVRPPENDKLYGALVKGGVAFLCIQTTAWISGVCLLEPPKLLGQVS